MTRDIVIEFLRHRKTFTSRDFREYMLSKNYSVQNAQKWLWIIQQEGLAKKIGRKGMITIYKSLIYQGR